MRIFVSVFLLFATIANCASQDVIVSLSSKMLDGRQQILLAPMDGWVFKKGNDPSWANKDVNTTAWTKLKPTELSSELADKNGRAEGWFRLRFKLDKDLIEVPLGMRRGGWAASDVYLDGQLVYRFGSTGTDDKNFREYNPIEKSSVPLVFQTDQEHVLAIHFVDYLSPLPPFDLRSGSTDGVRTETQGLQHFLCFTGPDHDLNAANFYAMTLPFRSIWLAVTVLLSLFFWLLVLLSREERKILLMIAICSTSAALSNLPRFFLTDKNISYVGHLVNELVLKLSTAGLLVTSFVIILIIFKIRISQYLKIILLTYAGFIAFSIFFDFHTRFMEGNIAVGFVLIAGVLVTSWKKVKGAQWTIVGGITLSTAFGFAATLSFIFAANSYLGLLLATGLYFSFPLSLLVYVSLRFKEIVSEVQRNAKLIVQMTEEKKEEAIKQQKVLEQEVARQTAELRTTLTDLKSTQSQLVQSEKMASLGELTAGIAHEIQNPLNFINNFSEVNKELIAEMNEELSKGSLSEAKEIANSVTENLEKINHHGKRADAIVKGMLLHSRTSTGQTKLTDINALCDEYVRLAYHGLRAKDKTFNAKIETDFDPSLPRISVVTPEIGRVVLNLINNAFYAVNERKKVLADGFEPKVTLATRNLGDKVEIKVIDNGTGIPAKVIDKIFQPFFTTKPAGQGTGLGLSLAYDIITKAHGGQIKVESNIDVGTMVAVALPNIQL